MQRTLNRTLSLLLAVVMVLSMIPVIASAAGETPVAEAVAVNTVTGEQYADVSDALKSATEGQTIKLISDAQDTSVTVRPNTKLDLNGNKLECKYYFCYGATVDNSAANTGLLVPSRVVFSGTNEQIAIHNGTGYQFFQVQGFNTKEIEGGKFVFQPLFEEGALELLANGMDASGVKIEVHVGYRMGGFDKTAIFYFSDALVNAYLESYADGKFGQMFTLSISNAAEFGKLTFTPAVSSTAGITITPAQISVDENGQLTEDVTLQNGQNSAVVGAGTLLEGGNLTLTTTTLTESQAEVELGAEETLTSLDVHVEGLAKDNTVPVLVTLTQIAPESLNKGNIHLYHVEEGKTVEMARVYSLAELDAHNEFYYDIPTGTVTVALCSFSEVAIVSDNENVWNGGFEDFDAVDGVYYIYNADQLAQMSKLVSTNEDYAKASYKLVADVNFGGESNVDQGHVFYPIGYWKEQEGKNKAGETYYDHGYNFTGIFDGNGNTISGIYQNTWAMDGDYDNGYWDAAMGLFGTTYDATIKNLTIDNFQSDGEFTVTGCVVAYAGGNTKFENITLTNCNPRVYNTGNGGIVGMNYNSTTEGKTDTLSFKNITIDQTNKISALWGSWDVGCGGIMGRLRDDEKHPTEINTATFENCHVSAVIDVYNDVCANYQYYQYRYSGMLIGTLDYVDTLGVDNLADIISATDCTVTYGDWNEYWYCELVANSLASYTHDHQFSRLEKITAESDIKDSEGNWLRAGNFVIPATNEVNAVCYHIVNKDGVLTQHKHEDSDKEVINGETILKEDRQHYYIPFHQLFTGYGWGSTMRADFSGVTVLEGGTVKSTEKFQAKEVSNLLTDSTVTIGDLFEANVPTDKINHTSLQVFVSPADESSTVSGSFSADTTTWENGKLTITGKGRAKITITDYFYCINTVLYVNVGEPIVRLHTSEGLTTVTGSAIELFTPTSPEDYAFVGWSTEHIGENVTDAPEELLTGSYIPTKAVTNLYAVYSRTETTDGKTTASYVKVTTTPTDWSGEYLIVYEGGKVAFNGGLSTLDAANNTISVTISNNTIASSDATDAAIFTIAKDANGKYTIKSKSGTYIGRTADSNELDESTSTAYTNTITLNGTNVDIIGSGGAYLRYNATSGQYRFRYYKSSSYTGQKAIALYKYTEVTSGGTEKTYYSTYEVACEHNYKVTETINATCTTAGSKTETCSLCGDVKITSIASKGHTEVIDAAVEATCTKTGLTEGSHCSVCEKVLVAQVEVPVIDHNYVEGTCDACGAEDPNYVKPETGTYAKATSIAVGDKVIFVYEDGERELTGISTTSTKYGIGTEYTSAPAATWAFTVEAGSTSGTYSFVDSNNKYLSWSSGNSLTTSTTKNANSSWRVTFSDGNAVIKNASDSTRQLQWNASSPRFACYDSNQTAIQLYKLGSNGGSEGDNEGGETPETPAEPTVVLEITKDDFNSTSYAANNNDKEEYNNKTGITYTYTSNQIMQQSGTMQWQKSSGYITITATNFEKYGFTKLELKKTAGTFTVTVGGKAITASGTTSDGASIYDLSNVTGDIKISVGSATGKVEYLKFYK